MRIYLDNSATTMVRPEVVESMLPFLTEHWGNPSSVHALGRRAKQALQTARQQVSTLLNCEPEEVYFSACGTMSNNCALLGRARFVEANGKGRHLITTAIEHPSVSGPVKYLESNGWSVTYVPIDREGCIDINRLKTSITDQTSIISVMWANNEVGVVEPIETIAQIAAEREIFFHTDAVQVPGKLSLDMRAVPVSALSLSGHKFFAPKGIGILYLRKLNNLMPIVFGGGQEMGILPGTEALSNIVAIGRAAELAHNELSTTHAHLRKMQELLKHDLLSIPNAVVTGPIDLSKRLPGHISLVVPGAEGEAMVMRADLKGLCISSGSACHQGIIEPSQVLRAMGFSDREALGSLRISCGKFNTIEECQRAASQIADIVSALNGIGKSKSATAVVPREH